VESHSLAAEFPLIDSNWSSDEIAVPGALNNAYQHEQISGTIVDGNYFEALGIPFLAGRTFDRSDAKDRPEVLVINHKMAETYWPGENPIGKQVHLQDGNQIGTIIGVVADSKYNTLDEPAHPVIYYALTQHYSPSLVLIVHTDGDPRLWAQPLAQMVRSMGLEVDIPPFTLGDVMHFTLLIPFLTLSVVLALGTLALALAVLGLYGAIFYSVNERKKEIGIRVALGARPSDLIQMFLRQTAIIASVGIAVGFILGVVATSILKAQFYGIRPVELEVLLPVSVSMMLVAMAIAYIAALPWITINPIEAVRHN
jgi:hypothetical protein